jgi:hypothetical protein
LPSYRRQLARNIGGDWNCCWKLKRTEYLERHAKLRRRAEDSIKPDVRKTASENKRQMEPA